MPTEAFIKAASASNREPVVLLAIESVDAIKKQVTTRADWEASSRTNINVTYVAGEVRLGTDGIKEKSGPNESGPIISNVLCSTGIGADLLQNSIFCSSSRAIGVEFEVAYDGPDFWNFYTYPCLYGKKDGGSWVQLMVGKAVGPAGSYGVPRQTTMSIVGLAYGSWQFSVYASSYDLTPSARILTYSLRYETHYLPAGSLTTSATGFDLGLIPTVSSRFESDDTIPTGCTVAYTAWGRNTTGDAWVSLGAITDGGPLAPYRYYQITADLTSSADGMETPLIDELRIVGGDAQYTYLSTHKDTPIQGALPYIMPGGISSISSKIDLTQQATVGELTAKLFWRKKIGDLIAGDYLKNKTIICKLGFVGLSEVDYEPYFVGTWHDYQSDHEKGIITVKTRNVLKQFTRKIPAAGYFLDATGKQLVPPRLKTYEGNIMAVMLILADALGITTTVLRSTAFISIMAAQLRRGIGRGRVKRSGLAIRLSRANSP